MRFPEERQIKPSEWVDFPYLEDLPQDKKGIIKVIHQTLKFRKDVLQSLNKFNQENRFPEVISSGQLNEILRLKTIAQGINKIKNIRVQFAVTFDKDDFSCVFSYHQGKITPQFLIKEIHECNLREVDLCKRGFHSKNQTSQLKTAILIIYGTVIEFFLGDDIKRSLTIREGIILVQQKIRDYPIEQQSTFRRILKLLNHSMMLYQIHESLETFINDIPHLSEEIRISPDHPHLIEIVTLCYEKSKSKLSEAIDKSIDLGLFNKYKTSSSKGLPAPICRGHSLLNNKKLLCRLKGESANKARNETKNKKLSQIKKFALGLMHTENNKHRFKNKTHAANELAQELGTTLEEYIQCHIAVDKLKALIKPENFPNLITKLISDDPQLHAYLIKKVEKSSKS